MKKFLPVLMASILFALICFSACQMPGSTAENGTTQKTETGTTTEAAMTAAGERVESSAEDTQAAAEIQTDTTSSAETQAVNTTRTETTHTAARTEAPLTQPQQTAAPSQPLQTNAMQVTLSVRCQTAVDAGSEVAAAVAPDGWMLAPTDMTITDGDTVLDVLERTDLVLGVRRSGYGSYVYSIQSLAERAVGSMSGWIYLVNGEQVQASCSTCELKDGDSVEWVYTLDGGKDVAS